ncbi:MAG: hypothetical protein ACE5F8_04995 [Woeseiaceae bacterium]
MSSEKQTHEQLRPTADVVLEDKPAKAVNVVKLELDDDFDLGSDPYNRTGSHCVIKLDCDE